MITRSPTICYMPILDATSCESQHIDAMDSAGYVQVVRDLLGICAHPSSRDHIQNLAIGNTETRDFVCQLILSAVKHLDWEYVVDASADAWLIGFRNLRTAIRVTVDPSLMP